MKKVLSFVLVLAMILGSVSMAFAAPYVAADGVTKENTVVPFEDAADVVFATVLRDLGILTGKKVDGKDIADLDGEISRAEFCAMIVRAMGLELLGAKKQATQFSDVDQDYWASGYIAVANNNGWVSGKPDGTFDPKGIVTAEQGLAFVVKALGYSDEHLEGSWPTNFIVKAADLGIVPKDYELTGEATRGDVFEVLYKALDVELVKWSTADNQYKKLDTGKKTINEKLGAGANDYVTTTRAIASATLKNGLDVSEYLGKNAKVLLKGTEIIAVLGENTVELKGAFRKADSFTSFVAVDKVVYDLPAASTTENAIAYKNGVEVSANAITVKTTDEVILNVVLNEKNAKLIDKIESIFVWTPEDRTVIVTASEAALLAADAPTASFAGVDNNINWATTAAVEGDATKTSEIQEGDVVKLYMANGNVAKAVVTRKSFVGKITKVLVSGVDAGAKFVVDGNTYEHTTSAKAAGHTAAVATSFVTEFAFYLDSEGDVVFFEEYKEPGAPEVEDVWSYGFVLATSIVEDENKAAWSDETGSSSTTYAIKLIVPGTTTEVVYEAKSTAAALKKDDATSSWAVAKGSLIKFVVEDDKLITMKAVDYAPTAATKPTDKVVNALPYATDLVVIDYDSANPEKAASYVPAAKADIVGKTFGDGNLKWVTNAAGYVDLVVIIGASTDKDVFTTAVAVYGANKTADGKFITVLENGVPKEYAIEKDSDADMDPEDWDTSTIYSITFNGGKVTDASVINNSLITVATATAMNGEFYVKNYTGADATSEATPILVLDPVVYKWNDTEKMYEVGTLDDVIAAKKPAYFINLDGVAGIELVVLK